MIFGNKKNIPPTPDQSSSAQAAAAPSGAAVFEAGTDDFEEKIIAASMQQPVLAYFTAPWCGPCQQLGPALEKAVLATNGEVRLGKIDLDSNQQLAAALRIQSVPTIFAFFQGRPVDAFQGALPESQIKAFLDKLVQAARSARPDALDIPESLKGAGQALADGDYATAQNIYVQILEQDEKNAQAYAGLVRTYIAMDQLEQARQLVLNAPEEIAGNSGFEEAKTALELADAKPVGALDDLQKKIEARPDDHQARFDLANAQFAAGQRDNAVENLLEIMRRKRDWNEEAARKQLLKFFEAMGPTDPLTIESRRKLSSLLFS